MSVHVLQLRPILYLILTHLFQQLIDAAEEKLNDLDPDDSNALLNLLRRMLNAVTTRATDVANYPNVRSYSCLV